MSPDWLDYGSLGLLALVLAGAIVFLRERDKRIEERFEKNDTFIQNLVNKSLEQMNEGIVVQRQMAEAMTRVTLCLDQHEASVERAHAEILTVLRGLSPEPLNRRGQNAGG